MPVRPNWPMRGWAVLLLIPWLAGCTGAIESPEPSLQPGDWWVLRSDGPDATQWQVEVVDAMDGPLMRTRFGAGPAAEGAVPLVEGVRWTTAAGAILAEGRRFADGVHDITVVSRWDGPCPHRGALEGGDVACHGTVHETRGEWTAYIARTLELGTVELLPAEELRVPTGATVARHTRTTIQTHHDEKPGLRWQADWWHDACGPVQAVIQDVVFVRSAHRCGGVVSGDPGVPTDLAPWLGPGLLTSFDVDVRCDLRLLAVGVLEVQQRPVGPEGCLTEDLWGDFALPDADATFTLSWDETPAARVRLRVGAHHVEGVGSPLRLVVPGPDVPAAGAVAEVHVDGVAQGTRLTVAASVRETFAPA